ncbi:MAG: DUF4355 domain-containing protein [Carnobacterium sp.]|uniref:DUF4355 domain-containing protein n=1 Tax=Carnobacterium sp. TaxID=48221 RepID=UPI002FC90CD3
MYNKYVRSVLNCRKYEADTGSAGKAAENNEEGENEDADDEEENSDDADAEKKPKTFTRAELAAIVKSESKKAVEAYQSEAEKLAGMNDKQKEAHEKQKLLDEIESYKAKENLQEMRNEAQNMLTEAELVPSVAVLDLVVRDTAEATQASVKALIDFASNLVKVNARQDTPKDSSAGFSTPEKDGSLSEMAKAARIIK